MNKDDLRVIKTKMALYNALIKLMKDNAFENIKVSDICNEALVNRSTFYAHYEDKYELLTDYINSLKVSLTRELAKNTSIKSSKEYYIEMMKLFLNHIEEKKDSYLAIAINNRNSILTDILYDYIDHDIISVLTEYNTLKDNSIPKSIVAKFYLGAVVNTATYWIQNINKYSKDDIINYLTVLIPDEIGK